MAKFRWKTGVYCIRNKINGKRYVGSSARSVEGRMVVHGVALQKGKHPNKHLQSAWNTYGKEAFEFLVLERCSLVKCIEREQHWMDVYQCYAKGYNQRPKAESCLGIKLSDEHKEKIRQGNLGKEIDREVVERTRSKNQGQKRSAESRAQMSVSQRKRFEAQEERDRIRDLSLAGMTEEVIQQMRESSARRWSKPMSEETREKYRKAKLGRKHTPEAKANMTKARRARAQKEREERLQCLES